MISMDVVPLLLTGCYCIYLSSSHAGCLFSTTVSPSLRLLSTGRYYVFLSLWEENYISTSASAPSIYSNLPLRDTAYDIIHSCPLSILTSYSFFLPTLLHLPPPPFI